MCGLYGFFNYSGQAIKNLSVLTNALAEEAAIRGTDATGIAYIGKGKIELYIKSLSRHTQLISDTPMIRYV